MLTKKQLIKMLEESETEKSILIKDFIKIIENLIKENFELKEKINNEKGE